MHEVAELQYELDEALNVQVGHCLQIGFLLQVDKFDDLLNFFPASKLRL